MYNWTKVFPKVIGYKLFRALNFPRLMPLSMTLSVTNQCNSRCKTCNIWKFVKENPRLKQKELSLQEYECIFRNIGDSVVWFTLSGGEPFLRTDLAAVAKSLYENCSPTVISIPTNGLLGRSIAKTVGRILDACPKSSVILTVSLDGTKHSHDEIRGIPKSFESAVETYKLLKELQGQYDNLEVDIHSVVSRFNVDKLQDIYDFVKTELKPDSYITEIAENRSELFNKKDDIAPDALSYERAIKKLCQNIKNDFPNNSRFSKLIRAFRLEYYNFVVKELKQKRQIIPCYAGIASCHISVYADIWPCCILAYDASMGNLREHNYEFKKIWFSRRADEVRKMVKDGVCCCPMANVHYTNVLCDTVTLFKVALNAIEISAA